MPSSSRAAPPHARRRRPGWTGARCVRGRAARRLVVPDPFDRGPASARVTERGPEVWALAGYLKPASGGPRPAGLAAGGRGRLPPAGGGPPRRAGLLPAPPGGDRGAGGGERGRARRGARAARPGGAGVGRGAGRVAEFYLDHNVAAATAGLLRALGHGARTAQDVGLAARTTTRSFPSDRPSASQSLTLTGCLKEAPGGGGAPRDSPGWSDGGRQSGRRWIHPHRRETGRVDGWWRNGAWRGDWHSGRGCDRNDRQRERSVDLSPDGWR